MQKHFWAVMLFIVSFVIGIPMAQTFFGRAEPMNIKPALIAVFLSVALFSATEFYFPIDRTDPIAVMQKHFWAVMLFIVSFVIGIPMAQTFDTKRKVDEASGLLRRLAPVPPIAEPEAPATDVPLSPDQERALKPKETFKECSNCPEMIVVPAGSFTMGSPANERGRGPAEGPQHTVTFARKFAVGKFALTFDEWDACVADNGCKGYKPSDQGWGRGRQPVISVSWDDAQLYVAWLSKQTGKPYRPLSEAEYEYATRAGMQTPYPWGNDIGKKNANCDGCGSEWDGKQTAPVGSFPANGFGLHDMVGNVWAWTEDCWNGSYNGAPADG
jgi:formylglycine-generating enzyme required for sulfatase activity